ncbi:MAG: hypothetical protein AB7V18_18675 [Pyrinomonadaceae bacterium]
MRMALLLFVCAAATLTVQTTAQCPAIKVTGPAGITNPGENVVFQVAINVVGPKLEFHWSVDKGMIVKGQGTPEITVLTDRSLAGEAVTATVEVEGLPQNCERISSETAGIAPVIGCGYPFDEWGEMKPNDERGRLDLMFAELSNNPNNVGMIVFRVKPGDRLDPTNRRIQFVLKHVKFRKFDKSRIWFALELAEEKSTRLYRIPPGAETPACDGCIIFRGESL